METIKSSNAKLSRISIHPFYLERNIRPDTYNFSKISTVITIQREYHTIGPFSRTKEIPLEIDLEEKKIFRIGEYVSGVLLYDQIQKGHYDYKGKPIIIPYTLKSQFFIYPTDSAIIYFLSPKGGITTLKKIFPRLFHQVFNSESYSYSLPKSRVADLRDSLDIVAKNVTSESDQTNVQRISLAGTDPDHTACYRGIPGNLTLIAFRGHVKPRNSTERWYITISENGGIYTANNVSILDFINFHREEISPFLSRSANPISHRNMVEDGLFSY
ncbi:MAG: hypothetical protein GF308_22280 [Candidatus Heimdallarchaeota archaeon]|nr:hypothetical protein [Candidatus Heimdallarchaeota archaeon]